MNSIAQISDYLILIEFDEKLLEISDYKSSQLYFYSAFIQHRLCRSS